MSEEQEKASNGTGTTNFFKVHFKGISALFMHNVRLADADDEFTIAIKEITGKQKKTKEDRDQIKWLEFQGGLYYEPDIGPYIDGMMGRKCLIEGGKKIKLGSALEIALSAIDRRVPLQYKGPREPEKLYAKADFVDHRIVSAQGKKGGGKTKRTRPCFAPPWEFTMNFAVNDLFVSPSDIPLVLAYAGVIGVGDGRSMGLGKFEAKIVG